MYLYNVSITLYILWTKNEHANVLKGVWVHRLYCLHQRAYLRQCEPHRLLPLPYADDYVQFLSIEPRRHYVDRDAPQRTSFILTPLYKV